MNKDQHCQDAYKSTCQLFKTDDINAVKRGVKAMEAFASGVLIKIDGRYLLFTAAHVGDYAEKVVYVGLGDNSATPLCGQWINNTLPDPTKRKEDKHDVAVLMIDAERCKVVAEKEHCFLSCGDIGINDELNVDNEYVMIGFPITWNKNTRCMTDFVGNPLAEPVKIVSEDIYGKLGYDSRQNIIVYYDKKAVFNYAENTHITTGPIPNGMSGGGLWYISKQNNILEKKLVGIIINGDNVNRRDVVIATRIDFFTEIVRQKLNLKIGKTGLFTITFK